ncbi:MAG TPA: hypothetical protein PK014_14110 [Thermoanaerobaculia bacterium]|nr:hypothetical protein [Thermoanaerobaculia bacterium]HUM31198.1 hypothetical protein [Thermoanaerobaculia bacterium]HXK69566.1 hypothetical protein [Thermoanaerobaculia bacterium]
MTHPAQVVNQIAIALRNGPFKVARNVTLSDGRRAAVAASRTYFSWKGIVLLSQHIVVRHIDQASLPDMKVLFDAGFEYAKKMNWVPLPRGLQFGFMVIPVLVGESPASDLVESVSKSPQKHFSLFEFPVVVDLATNQAHYFKGLSAWGAFFFSDLRKVAETYIQGSLYRQKNPGK